MNLRITPQINKVFPGFTLGAVILKNINNEKQFSITRQLLTGVSAEKKNLLSKNGLELSPGIATWRRYLESFGVNTEKHPPLIERIFRAFSKSEITFYTAVEDFLNYFALKYEMPVWGIDIDELCGDLELGFATGNEPFVLRGSAKLVPPENGEVVYRDKAGAISRMWNTYESERTAIMPFTKNICVFAENAGILGVEKLKNIIKEIGALISKYCGGSAESYILGDTVFEIDLGVAGKTGITDASFSPDPKRIALQQKFLKGPLRPPIKLWVIKHGKKIEKKPKTAEPKPAKEEKKQNKAETKLIKDEIYELLKNAVKKTFPEMPAIPGFVVEVPKDQRFGDYSSNAAMVLAKILKTNPREIFNQLENNIEKTPCISKISFAEPGFINFSIDKTWLEKELSKIAFEEKQYWKLNIGGGENVIVDFSSPNIAKPLGIHHLLSTVIGQALINIYRFIGYNALGLNYLGDWGTQFGKLITAYKTWGDKEKLTHEPINEMLKLYVKFHDEAEKDKSLENKAREEFKKLEDKDKENIKIWEWFKELSLKDIQKTYDKLGGVHFDIYAPESFYNDKMAEVLDEGKQKGIFIEGEGGALIVKFDDPSFSPYLVQKSDGATLYSTRDLASIKHRLKEWNPSKLIYVVDKSQSLYFKQLFKTAELLGWTKTAEFIHVDFGRMSFKDSKMSTRKGNIVLLDEVLDEAIEKAKAVIEQKNPKLSAKEKSVIARAVGIGAVKYNILSQNRTTDIVFDWSKMLSLESNSASYLQYTYTRAMSILRKSKEKQEKEKPESQISIFDAPAAGNEHEDEEKEFLTARLAIKFPEYIVESAEQNKPNILTNYLYELAQNFNAFYHTTPVLQSKDPSQRKTRLALTGAVAKIISTGLNLLGIECTEKM